MDYDAYPGSYTMWWSDLLYRDERGCKEDHHWRSPRHMPKWACRLWLEVVDVRKERLQEITEEDAKREGVEPEVAQDYGPVGMLLNYRLGFAQAWDTINPDAPWESNPEVYRIEFKVAQ